ncbi:MAG: metallophosphoesterase [bacterium]|nr:metallophosphoesterase [bacterium]
MIPVIKYLVSAIISVGFTVWVYKWLFIGYEPKRQVRTATLVSLFIPLILYLAGSLTENQILITFGSYWSMGFIVVVIMTFFEVGLSKIFIKRRYIFIIFPFICALLALFAIPSAVYNTQPLDGFMTEYIAVAVILGLYLALYKRIIIRFELTDIHKGLIIIFLWITLMSTLILSRNAAIVVIVWMNYFVYSRTHYALNLSKNGNLVLLGLFTMGFIISFPVFSLAGNLYGIKSIYIIGGIWLGIMSISFGFFTIEFYISLLIKKQRRIVAAVFLAVIIVVSSISIYNGSGAPVLREVEIPVTGLGAENSGFSIVQITDLHLGDLQDSIWLSEIVERVNKLDPDMVVITGDILEHEFEEVDEFIRLTEALTTRHGIFAVTGNHEYYFGIDRFEEIISRTKIRVLNNEMINIDEIIHLIGISDSDGRSSSHGGPDLESAMNGLDIDLPVVLLSHRPDSFEENAEKGVDLQLSGHTHSGQIPPIEWFVRLYYDYYYGLNKYKDSFIYTSSGTGLWGLKMRFLSRSEIVKIVLTNR